MDYWLGLAELSSNMAVLSYSFSKFTKVKKSWILSVSGPTACHVCDTVLLTFYPSSSVLQISLSWFSSAELWLVSSPLLGFSLNASQERRGTDMESFGIIMVIILCCHGNMRLLMAARNHQFPIPQLIGWDLQRKICDAAEIWHRAVRRESSIHVY